MNEELLNLARSRANHLQEFYERQAGNYGKLARVSSAGSYVCYLAGALSLTAEPISFRSAMTSAVIIGGGAVLGTVKKEMRFSQQFAEVQVENEQNFVETLEKQLSSDN